MKEEYEKVHKGTIHVISVDVFPVITVFSILDFLSQVFVPDYA
jgi:hypothetical protein